MTKQFSFFMALALLFQSFCASAGTITLVRANKKAHEALKHMGGYTFIAINIKALAPNGRLSTKQLHRLIDQRKKHVAREPKSTENPSSNPSRNTEGPIVPLPKSNVSKDYTYKVGNTRVVITKGDITKQNTDAIVNAANSNLQHGAGIAAAIDAAAGPLLQPFCNRLGEIPVGNAIVTPSFNLAPQGIKKIIHAVGPDCRFADQNNQKHTLLAQAYTMSLNLASRLDCKSISFPSISTGIFGFDIKQAAPVAVKTALDYIRLHNDAFTEVRFVLYTDEQIAEYKKAIDAYAVSPTIPHLPVPDESNDQGSFSMQTLLPLGIGVLGVIGLLVLAKKLYDSNNNNN